MGFEIQKRCVAATEDGREYFGEVFKGDQRIYLDPADPRRNPQPQVTWAYPYQTFGGAAGGGKTANVDFGFGPGSVAYYIRQI